MRILYVEDNIANVSLVKRIARNDEVINYIDGEEALRNFEKDAPDMVLMDIQLAGRMTGIDVVQKLRADGYTLPIIAVTAYAMVGDRERCLAAGCDDYIAKPLPISKLVEIFEIRRKLLANAPSATLVESFKPVPVVPAELPVPVPSVVAQPETVTTQPEAVTAQPEAVTAQPEAVTAQPEAVVPQPEAVTAQPEAVVPQPEAITAQSVVEPEAPSPVTVSADVSPLDDAPVSTESPAPVSEATDAPVPANPEAPIEDSPVMAITTPEPTTLMTLELQQESITELDIPTEVVSLPTSSSASESSHIDINTEPPSEQQGVSESPQKPTTETGSKQARV